MALKLAGRNPAKFTYSDGVSETTVTIQPDDPPEAVQAKLQRVLELEGGPTAMSPLLAAGQQMVRAAQPEYTPAERAAEEARLAQVQTMGWTEEGSDIDNLPEYQ